MTSALYMGCLIAFHIITLGKQYEGAFKSCWIGHMLVGMTDDSLLIGQQQQVFDGSQGNTSHPPKQKTFIIMHQPNLPFCPFPHKLFQVPHTLPHI